MKFGDLSKEIEEGLQKVYEKNLKIISCLNDFQEIVIKNYKMPLTIILICLMNLILIVARLE